MAVPSILHDLIKAGVEFQTDGERIRWRNSGDLITADVIATLRSHKAEIIGHLVGRAEPYLHKGNPGFRLDAIRAGIAAAFNEFEAMNDPHDPRAWA